MTKEQREGVLGGSLEEAFDRLRMEIERLNGRCRSEEQAFFRLQIQKETREDCAKIVKTFADGGWLNQRLAEIVVAAIRSGKA